MSGRLNIEKDLPLDPAFLALVKACGGKRFMAFGYLVEFWFCAQRYWQKSESGVPLSIFRELDGSSLLLKYGWAIKQDQSVFARGGREQFGWLRSRQKASENSAAASSMKAKENSTTKRPRTDHETTTKRPPLFSLLSSLKTNTGTYVENSDPATNGSGLPAEPSAPRDVHPLVEIWEQNRGTLSGIRGLSKKRERALALRWQSHPDPTYWAAVVKKMAASSFCRGETPGGWRADFDWLLKPDTHLRVMEGKYDNRGASKPKIGEDLTAEDFKKEFLCEK